MRVYYHTRGFYWMGKAAQMCQVLSGLGPEHQTVLELLQKRNRNSASSRTPQVSGSANSLPATVPAAPAARKKAGS